MISPFPDFKALWNIRISLGSGFMLPNQEESGQHRQTLRVDVERPRTFRKRGNSQLLEKGVLEQNRLVGKRQVLSDALINYKYDLSIQLTVNSRALSSAHTAMPLLSQTQGRATERHSKLSLHHQNTTKSQHQGRKKWH